MFITCTHAHTDVLLGDSQKLSRVMSEWSETTVVGAIQFIIQQKSYDYLESESEPRSGLVRVYHQLYGDYESYLSYIVTPSTEAGQLLQMAVVRLSPSEATDNYQLVLKTGTRGNFLSPYDYV